ncbi:hypothetical protein SUGI_0250950 [Cryptomeria japonica]|nr:hypothetical protein SUGI_0250950 [Cryptomeria japonica]
MLNKDGDNTCPLCTEELGWINMQIKPCQCGYQLCIWCWFRVVEVAEADCTRGRCPHCRTSYDKEKVIQMLLNLASPRVNTQNKSQKLSPKLFQKLRMFSVYAKKNKEACNFSTSADCPSEASGRNSDSSRNGGFRKAVSKLGKRLEIEIIEKWRLVTSGWRKIKKPC